MPEGAMTAVELPSWDLSDLYPGRDSAELQQDFATAEADATAFAKRLKGQVAALSATELASAIARYEAIDERLTKLVSYAGLVYAGDVSDPQIGKFYQSVSERVNAVSSRLLFFPLEVNRIAEEELQPKLADPALAHWAPWLRDTRVFREHQLSDEIETLLHERGVVGADAWGRLFDQTIASLRVPIGEERLTLADALNRLTADPDRARRKSAGEAIGQVMGENARLFAFVTSTLAKDKGIDDRWRHYATPQSYRNRANQVEDEVVQALVTAVKGAYPRLSHRYYALKARWMGNADGRLDYYDRNAPLPDQDDRAIAWPDARRMVLDAYTGFSPRLGEVGARFFDNPWIDVPPRPGKSPGAFAHPTVPSAHPYLLLNYHGRTRDVMTLAHELGHGVHQVLAGAQGHLMSSTPLTLAETASVFGEMLTFRALLDAEKDPKRRRTMLAGKVEDGLNTLVRQIAFYEFESRVHAARQTEELTADEIGEIWMAVQAESLGPALRFDEGYRNYWAYIPHFIHSPFYVYAYAFGDCLVNALYAVYEEGQEGFQEKYLEMLTAGGTKRHKELLAPFGLDASDPAFWSKGLNVIAGMIDRLEAEAD